MKSMGNERTTVPLRQIDCDKGTAFCSSKRFFAKNGEKLSMMSVFLFDEGKYL